MTLDETWITCSNRVNVDKDNVFNKKYITAGILWRINFRLLNNRRQISKAVIYEKRMSFRSFIRFAFQSYPCLLIFLCIYWRWRKILNCSCRVRDSFVFVMPPGTSVLQKKFFLYGRIYLIDMEKMSSFLSLWVCKRQFDNFNVDLFRAF